jgi:hypothetical protein
LQQNGRQTAGSSRRIGGGGPATGGLPAVRLIPSRGWLLKIAAFAFAWPLFLALVRGSVHDALGLLLACILLYLAGRSIERGSREEMLNEGRPLAQSPTPWKLIGAAVAGLGASAASFGSGDGVAMSLLYGALVAGTCIFTYGLDPRADHAALEASRAAT